MGSIVRNMRAGNGAGQAERGTASLHCSTCADKQVVVEAGRDRAAARRCPDCSTECRECGGTLSVFTEDWTGQTISAPCRCASLDARIADFNRASIPRRYHAATVESFHDHTETQRIAKMLFVKLHQGFSPGSRGIGLTGPVGCGKTHLLCAAAHLLTLERGIPCRFIEFTHLLAEIRAGYDAKRSEHDIIDHLVDVPVLLIDELGKGLTTEWQMAILDTLVSRRYDRNVSTFFATNYPFERRERTSSRSRENFDAATLEDRIGQRMMSRLSEMCALVSMQGPDYRRDRPDPPAR